MRRRRGRRQAGPWIVMILILAVALWLLLRTYVFVVRSVDVVGSGSVAAEEAARMSGIRLGSRMAAVDPEKVRASVEEDGRLAFVGLERRLPNRIRLTVRERSLDALIIQAGKVLVLDSDAYVVRITDRLPEQSIPYVTGLKPSNNYALGKQLDTNDGRCAAMKAVLEALKAQGATGYVSELSVADLSDLRAITRTGMTVLLGDASNMNAKIIWMAGALADLEARGETAGKLDVSSATKADFMPARVVATPVPVETPLPVIGDAAAGAGDSVGS